MRIKSKQGFTLIEVMLVLIIISVLAAMVVPNLSGKGKKAKIAAAKVEIESNLSTALGLYELDNGQYPTTDQGLRALLEKPSTGTVSDSWDGPYLKKKVIPNDPWGKDYIYVSPGANNTDSYDLSSLGPDGVESADDLNNWSVE